MSESPAAVFPPCIRNSSEIPRKNGEINIYQTFLLCLSRVNSPKLIPSVFTPGTPLEVTTAIQLNNIGDIDPAGALVEVDFYLSLWWNEDRLSMPQFWNTQSLEIQKTGIHLDRIFYDPAGIFIFRPDVFFHDGIKVVTEGERLRLTVLSHPPTYIAYFSLLHLSKTRKYICFF
jgi:hypothetical protein